MRPVRECLVPSCGPKPIKGRGYCSLHYTRLRDYGDPVREPTRQPKVCIVNGCDKPTCAKSMCQMHYLRVKNHGDPHANPRFYAPPVCTIDGCDEPTKRGRYCGLHRGRMERYGRPDLPPRTGRHDHTQGYKMVRRPGHPVARKDGWALEHRVVLFDAIGEGPHPCHWCSKPLRWTGSLHRDSDFLVVDHLDDDRRNNDRSNLAPSCSPCNTVHSYVIVRQRVARSSAST